MAPCAASSEGGPDSLALRLQSPRGAPLRGSRDQVASLGGAEGRPGGCGAGEGRTLCFRFFSEAVEENGPARSARRQRDPLQQFSRRRELSGLRWVRPLPHVCIKKTKSLTRLHFCFLSQQRLLHLERVGVDVHISTSRVSREAKRGETPRTRRGLPGVPGAPRTRLPLSGSRQARSGAARSPARCRRGGAVARGCGLVPAAVAPAPSPATDGRRAPPPWRDLPLPASVEFGERRKIVPGHFGET